MDILLENIVWKNLVYTITFFSLFFRIAGYLKRKNETPTPI